MPLKSSLDVLFLLPLLRVASRSARSSELLFASSSGPRSLDRASLCHLRFAGKRNSLAAVTSAASRAITAPTAEARSISLTCCRTSAPSSLSLLVDLSSQFGVPVATAWARNSKPLQYSRGRCSGRSILDSEGDEDKEGYWSDKEESEMVAMKPGVLQLEPEALPSLGEVLRHSNSFDYYSLWEQSDVEAFLSEKGQEIYGVVTSPGCKTRVDRELVSRLPNLEFVSSLSFRHLHGDAGAGAGDEDHEMAIDSKLCKELGVNVSLICGSDPEDIVAKVRSDEAEALLLAVTKELVVSRSFMRRSHWPSKGDYPIPFRLSNKHVGIVGLGRIGAAIARRLEGFGGTIAYWSRSIKPEFPNYTFYDNVVELAKHSDILIAACALTKETTKLINREVLDALGPQGFFVNIARGQVADEAELVKALVEGRIAGAGLDVFENEPAVPRELLTLDTVVLQPHLASATIETRQEMAHLLVANIEAHLAGKPLVTPVF